jgi:hypothetical protein
MFEVTILMFEWKQFLQKFLLSVFMYENSSNVHFVFFLHVFEETMLIF